MKKVLMLSVLAVLACAPRAWSAAAVTLGWDAVTTNADGSAIGDLSGYRVFYATYSLAGLTTGQAMGIVSVTKVDVAGSTQGAVVPNLGDGTSYYFRLTAFDTSGNHSGWSAQADGVTDLEVSTWTAAAVPVKAPTGLTASTASATQINLGWTRDALGNEDGFKVEWATNAGFAGSSTITVAGNGVTGYPHTGLIAGTTYYYRVRAYNGLGESGNAGPVSAVTPNPPAAPASPQVPAVSSTTITVTWVDGSTNESGFYVERSLSASGGFVQVGVVGAKAGSGSVVTFNDVSGLTAGTQYYYRVRAYNGDGTSGYTAVVAAQTSAVGLSGFTPPPGLKTCYAYPNPAVGVDPVIRAMMGGVDLVEITIYDAAGQAVKTDRVTTPVNVNGEMAYEYRWTGKKASGVYYAVVHGKKGSETIRARASFAVVR